jgi:hypothetical protein
MARTSTMERRLSGVTDRRVVFGRGGRRANDRCAPEIDLRVSCQACGTAWASLSAITQQGGERVAHYLCPRCAYVQHRAVAVA